MDEYLIEDLQRLVYEYAGSTEYDKCINELKTLNQRVYEGIIAGENEFGIYIKKEWINSKKPEFLMTLNNSNIPITSLIYNYF